jgi:hypothetical protein
MTSTSSAAAPAWAVPRRGSPGRERPLRRRRCDLVPDDWWRVRADNVAGMDKALAAFAVCLG